MWPIWLCVQRLQPNYIAVAESWLSESFPLQSVSIDGYDFHNHPRNLSCNSGDPALTKISQQHGGVGIYSKHISSCHVIQAPNFNIECLDNI